MLNSVPRDRLTFVRGGLEMLFNNESKHRIHIPAKDKDNAPVNVGYLVRYLCDNTMQDERKELFVLHGSV